MYNLSSETPDDAYEVEDLYDLVFAPGREALSSYRLREGVDPLHALCVVARDEFNVLAGAVRFWPVQIGEAKAVLLGPIAVHPTRQGEGLGALLMAHGLEQAETAGWARTLLVGDLSYYRRFGFEKLAKIVMPPPTNPDRVLGLGAWENISGRVRPARSQTPD